MASREVIDRDTLRRRLLLCLFALGTNMGITAIVAAGEHGETEAALRHVRRHYITRDNLRRRSPAGQRHPRGPRPALVGYRHRVRVGLQEVRLVGLEPDDRMPPPLRRARRDDLLARRTPLPASTASSRPARPRRWRR